MTWRIPVARPDLPPLDEYASALRSTWDSRILSNFGPNVEALEALASEYLGVPTLAVASGDVGLICAVAALGLPKGSRVLVPSFTFQSTVNSILWNGLVPVFVDIDPDTFTVDVEDCAEVEDRRRPSPIVVTACFGAPPAPDFGQDIPDSPIIVDAAHAYGTFVPGDEPESVATFGRAAVYSLSGTKVVTTAEGGLVSSRDAAFLDRVRMIRGYGFLGDYDAQFVGINGKMSELHAALGLLTMKPDLVDFAVGFRNGLAARYRANLSGLPLRFQRIPAGCISTFKDFAVIFGSVTGAAKAEVALSHAGIQSKRYFRPLHMQPAYRQFATRPLPVTEGVYSRILCLPIFGSMTTAEVDEVCAVVAKAVA